jgi:hypothetical protein
MAIRRSRDGLGYTVADITTTDGLNEKLGTTLCSNILENGELPVSTWSYAGTLVPSTTPTQIVAAGTGITRNYCKSVQISHAVLGAAVTLIIQDGSTTIWQGQLQTPATDAGGYTLNFDPPIKASLTTALNVVFSGATTGNVYVNMQGYVT